METASLNQQRKVKVALPPLQRNVVRPQGSSTVPSAIAAQVELAQTD